MLLSMAALPRSQGAASDGNENDDDTLQMRVVDMS